MKKIIITILLALTALVSNAQKCKFLVDKKDIITGKELKETNYIAIPTGKHHSSFNNIRFLKDEVEFFIYNQFHVWVLTNEIVSKDQEFIIKLENGSQIKIQALNDVEGNKMNGGNFVQTKWDVKCKISKEDLMQIANSKPIAITTLNFSLGKGIAIEIGKEGKDISKAAECILQ